MKRKSLSTLIWCTATLAASLTCQSCHHVDNHRLPGAVANLLFWTEADWVTHGVSGAGQYKIFNKSKRIPANYQYHAASLTGLGGVLVCTTFIGEPVAYDLACPVECRGDITVFINEDMKAECMRCHSCYDVFSMAGAPVSGEAAEHGYGLQRYHVTHGPNGEYMVIY